ncbi:MAG: LytR C-terminal domain-containing protein [Elusimicrobia bacterium]|nr:LytR C-terminal domain-containing protein [Elusimicrobiota bacterium]
MDKTATLTERLLTGLVLAAVLTVGYLESRSALAGRVQALQPFVVWTALKTPDEERPDLFLYLHQPARETLDIIHIPDGFKLGPRETLAAAFKKAAAAGASPREAAREACLRVHERILSKRTLSRVDLGAPRFVYEEARSFPVGDPAVAMKRRLQRDYSGLAFWKGFPRLLRRPGAEVLLSSGAGADVAFLERLLHVLELHRLAGRTIRPAWLPEGPAIEPFFLRLLGTVPRPAGAAPRSARFLFRPCLGRCPQDVWGPQARPVTVEVLNATGMKGIAREATKVLRLKGADVLSSGNAEGAPPGTLVHDRTGRIENALLVRDMLGCQAAEAVTIIRERTIVDVSVVVGEDCAGPLDRRPPESQ